MKSTLLGCVVVGAALVLAPGSTAAAAGCTWTASALALPDGGGSVRATTTNHQGGYSGIGTLADGRNHAVSWRNGQFIDYGTTVGDRSVTNVADENRAGTVVGTATLFRPPLPYPGPTYAFRSTNGRLEQLPQPPGADRVSAFAINDRGDITGENYVMSGPNFGHHVLRWPADRPGEVVQLPIPTNHIPRDADEDGSVLLWSPDGPKIWRNGALISLGTIPGAYSLNAERIANGRVVGGVTFELPNYQYRSHGVLWDTNGNPQQLPNSASARFINRDGLIAGRADDATGGGTGIWRLNQFEHAFPGSESVLINTVADDGTLVGARFGNYTYTPHIWRCR